MKILNKTVTYKNKNWNIFSISCLGRPNIYNARDKDACQLPTSSEDGNLVLKKVFIDFWLF